MGLHYPNLDADPVKTAGYYYSKRHEKLARLQVGEKLPRHMAPWEFIARDDEGTSSEIVARLRELHPELDPYKLSYTTTTPVDIGHLARRRMKKLGAYVLLGAAAAALGVLFAQVRLRRA